MRRIKPGMAGRLRYAAEMRRKPISLAGHLRMYWQDFVIHVLFEGGEICQDCGRGYVLWWAPDDLYREVHGSSGGLLCPACFSRKAETHGLVLEFVPRVFLRDGIRQPGT
jgi:hypothetical protein